MALTKICPTCGRHNLPVSPFCSNPGCGVSLVAVAPSEHNDKPAESFNPKTCELGKIVCPDCKAENEAGVVRCVYCDFAIGSDTDGAESFHIELNWPWGKELMTLPLRIGRESPSPDSVIKAIAAHGYDNISRSHAELLWDSISKGVFLTDLGSSNGTFVDGVRIPSNKPIALKSGALVRFAANLSVTILLPRPSNKSTLIGPQANLDS